MGELHLARHERRVDLGIEATASPDHLGGARGGGDDARLFDDHRHHVVVVVHPDVQADAVRERVGPEDVLHELVRGLRFEAAALERRGDLVGRGARRLADEEAALFDGDLVEAGEAGCTSHEEVLGGSGVES
jgi:hypothetical protein